MKRRFEERTCIVCGGKWTVETKSVGKKSQQCICSNCRNTLTPAEKQLYYRKHEGTHIIEKRTCLKCGKTWEVATAKDRIGKKVKQHYFCSDCSKELTISQKKKIMKEKREGYKESKYLEKRRSRLRNIQHYIWSKAKQRAEKNGLEFNIEDSDIIIPKVCPLLEIPLEWGVKGNYESSPSLDRIDSTKGYIKGNVWIISKKANSMKNSATFKELQTFYKNILRYSLTSRKNEPVELQDKEPVG